MIVQNSEISNDVQQKIREFRKLWWNNFLYNPIVIIVYKLDSHYCDEILDTIQWDGFLKQEIIRITPKNERDAVIIKYSKYVGKLEGFSESHLWGNLTTKSINW